MRTFRYFVSCCTVFILVSSCSGSDDQAESTYPYLAVCYEDFFWNEDVDIAEELSRFEASLIQEGKLKDSTGASYISLLDELSHKEYFPLPLPYDQFSKQILYKTPDELISCAQSVFGIDSSLVQETNFHHAQQRINQEGTKRDEMPVQLIFSIYAEELQPKDFEGDFVRYSLLHLLYRWYFKSKNDHSASLPKSDTTEQKNH
ncbi:MAG: hypothetical protein ACQERC_12470 [Bacteroidota bacterium]